jgi:hypothetical protein
LYTPKPTFPPNYSRGLHKLEIQQYHKKKKRKKRREVSWDLVNLSTTYTWPSIGLSIIGFFSLQRSRV